MAGKKDHKFWQSILAAEDIKREPTSIPEWGMEDGVFVREMSGEERERWEDGLGKEDNYYIRASLIALCLVDVDGERIVPDDGVGVLSRKSASVLMRLYDECQRLNGLSLVALEELEKNSPETQGADSGSD